MAYFDYTVLMHRLAHYSGPVELHITVQLENKPSEKARFKAACQAKDGKFIWIELEDGHSINQPMFGTRMSLSPQEQADRIKTLVDSFAQDFSVKRVKVEAGPHNKNIPQSVQAAKNEPADCYFEHHLALELKADTNFGQLKSNLATYQGYLSRNAFKTVQKSGDQIRFVTQRFSKLSQEQADAELEKLIAYAKRSQFNIISVEREYNIFDSNLHLDQGWM